MKKSIALIFILSLFTPLILAAPNYVISNSDNWEDVYSSVLYANLEGFGSDFLVSTAHGPLLLNGINKENELLIVTSKESPFVFNYGSFAEAEGFASVTELEVSSANLELISRLPNIKNFIIVSDAYGYNSMAVIAYALETKSWVFLASRSNLDEINSILNSRTVDSLLLYGYLDSEITETLSEYNPKIINTGDRFQDNINLVKEYSKIKPITQVILSNGGFVEKEIMQGKNALLFTGVDNVPVKIADYIKDSEIEIGVLIGNELIGAATNIRQSTGMNVMVKFARSARERTSGVSAVEGLDLFPLPMPNLNLTLYSIKYNKATSTIEVTYESNSNMPAYFKGTLTLISQSGTKKIGDLEEIFIAPEEFKTVVYNGIEIPDENLSVDLFTLYGETPTSLDRVLKGRYGVQIVNVIDRCSLDLRKLKYNFQEKAFIVKIKNSADVECWTSVELKEVTINKIKTTIGTDSAVSIKPGRAKRIFIYETMTKADLEENNFVKVVAYYGERRDSLVNLIEKRFELDYQRFNSLTYIIFILVILIIIFIILAIIARKKDED